jgi:hypothetical protein
VRVLGGFFSIIDEYRFLVMEASYFLARGRLNHRSHFWLTLPFQLDAICLEVNCVVHAQCDMQAGKLECNWSMKIYL